MDLLLSYINNYNKKIHKRLDVHTILEYIEFLGKGESGMLCYTQHLSVDFDDSDGSSGRPSRQCLEVSVGTL